MKSVISLLLMVFISSLGWAQTDLPKTQPLKISADKKLDVKNSPNQGTALNMPSVITPSPDINLKDASKDRNVKMLPEKELKQAGFDLKLDPKVGEAERGKSNKFFGDMYLGDVKTTSKFVGVVCRD
ncbi:MAG: hypothetical protein KJN96_05875, partial [Eudoraea sp.]|nr:hypothetical protein [Eudoraea sp.]